MQIDIDRLRREIEYLPDTGKFVSRVTLKPLGTFDKSKGFSVVTTQGKRIPAHRLAFLYMTGKIPEAVIRKNGDKLDNRWSNLKATTLKQTQKAGGRANAAKYK